MQRERLIVLKFGGSVLRDRESLLLAVQEIYRWRRAGWSVVAVVSAFSGKTDRLLERCAAWAPSGAPESLAATLASGELESAGWLGLALDRAGVPARVLTPAALELVADGDPLDAFPQRMRREKLDAALARGEVVVVPGFVAEDERGGTVLLGRGGSDLTALFLAHALAAERCLLVKDVDGLYERDPAGPGPPPRRLARASWGAALELDGTVVQHKAVRFARSVGLEFELGAIEGREPTRVGVVPSSFAHEREGAQPLRVALLGCGTVGGGVWQRLRAQPERFDVRRVLVRSLERVRVDGPPAELLTDALEDALRAPVDVVVETLGGLCQATRAIELALERGLDVVTANKAVISRHGARLLALARERGCRLSFSASVGGSLPLLEWLAVREPGEVLGVRGVLNGTTNYVLGAVERGLSLAEAVGEAQAQGFAEADADRDLSGDDAADKLSVIGLVLGAEHCEPECVQREALSPAAIGTAARRDSSLRHVASVRVESGAAIAYVGLETLRAPDPLADVAGEGNAAVIELRSGEQLLLRGRGAGRWPTTEAVLGDLLELGRARTRPLEVCARSSA